MTAQYPEPLPKIVRNSARCDMCGDEIESMHRHDFKWCTCRNIAVDGGTEYLRRVGMEGLWSETSVMRPLTELELTEHHRRWREIMESER